MERYEGYIKQISIKLSSFSPGIKDDLAQEMCYIELKNSGIEPALMKRKMYSAAVDCLRKYTKYRKEYKRDVKMLSYEELSDNGLQVEAPSNEESTVNSIWITQMLCGLRKVDRQLMIDYFLKGLTLEEIAAKRGVTDGFICQIKRRCLDTLWRRHQQDI